MANRMCQLLIALCLISPAYCIQANCQNIDKGKVGARKTSIRKPNKKSSSSLAAEIKQGLAIYKSNDCAACHTIAGKGCNDGLPLDGVGRRRSLEFLKEHLKNPEEHVTKHAKEFGGDPVNMMTNPNLDQKEISLLSKYLKSLR